MTDIKILNKKAIFLLLKNFPSLKLKAKEIKRKKYMLRKIIIKKMKNNKQKKRKNMYKKITLKSSINPKRAPNKQ
jgi:hypothetical protein